MNKIKNYLNKYSFIEIFFKIIDYLVSIPLCNLYGKILRISIKNRKKGRGILVFETGNIGDGILSLDSLKQLELYSVNNNIRVSVICSESLFYLYKEICGFEKFTYCTYKNKDNICFNELLKLIRDVNLKEYDYVLVRDTNLLTLKIASTVFCKNKLFYTYLLFSDFDFFKKFIYDRIFNDIKYINENGGAFEPFVWKSLLCAAGIPDWKTSAFKIKNDSILKRDFNYGKYTVICPEATEKYRNIEIDTVCDIIQYISDNRLYDSIIVSTGNIDAEYNNELENRLKKYNNVVFINKTSLSEFFALLYNSSLVIGCDSGSVHIASHMNVKTICLCGYYQSGHFYPYNYDIKSDFEPCCIFAEKKDCIYCIEKNQSFFCRECLNRVKNGLNSLCIHNIDKDKILNAIGLYSGKEDGYENKC